jgi:hypothetical protein
MLIPVSTFYAEAVNRSHRAAFKVEVLDGAGVFLAEIPFLDGNVSATLGSQITRTAELLTDPALSPADVGDLLYPAGNRLKIWRGIQVGCEEPDLFPIFHGRINNVVDKPRSPTRLRAVDLSGDIRDAGFIVPETPSPGASIISEFKRLVLGALPSATFGVSDAVAAIVGERSWDTDRSQALDDLANSVACFWYTTGSGDFVMRRVPWTYLRSPDLIITDVLAPSPCENNEDPPITVLPWLYAQDSVRERSRENVYNVVAVAAEHVSGQAPLLATEADQDPTSPTWVGGNFGIKSLHQRTDVALTAGQLGDMARTTLRRSKALTDSWALDIVPDCRLELGDCIEVRCQRVTSMQVIASMRIPLTEKGSMQLGLRALLPDLIASS